jgi:hypothetical protein
MRFEEEFDQAVAAIADGRPVDWDGLAGETQDADEQERLDALRIISEIAKIHRSPIAPAGGESVTTSTAAPPAVPDAPSSGTWGRYRLLEKVGEGSYGSVYRAWDPQLERELAIKLLHDDAADARAIDRLLPEARALAKVRHPNVVNVIDVGSNEGRVGLSMEYIHGQTLEDVLRRQGPLAAAEATLIGQDVCRALAAVHRAGLVHRDVKARNVMREQAGRIVLMDFGTGREVHLLERAGQADVAGTPIYMAPEVLAGRPASVRSDVYSVGVLIYHLASRRYPFTVRTMAELRAAHGKGDRRFLSESRPDLPASFVRVVERCLAPDPRERFGSMGELVEALSRVIGGEPRATIAGPNRLVRAVTGIVAAVWLATAMGFLNSLAFNVALERSDFVTESPWDWFVWGVRSSLGPLLILLLGFIALALFNVSRHLALRASSTVARLDTAVQAAGRKWAARLPLEQPSDLSSWAFVVSSGALALAWWWFWPLLAALATSISRGSPERLTLLSPAFADYQASYRQVFSCIVIGTVAVWYGLTKVAARRGHRLPPPVLAGAGAAIFLSFASLDFPYRLLLHNEFEAARWNGASCYILGERTDDLLLFCPDLPVPRNRVVQKSTATVERQGRRESLFTAFGRFRAG